MPLFKSINVNATAKVLVWKIQESFEELFEGILLTEESMERVNSMKSELHQRGFLSVRNLLKEVGYSDSDLYYDAYGKPHLKDGNHISISHSFTFSGIFISKQKPVGMDIEMQREKILKIAHKFTPIQEYRTIANAEALISKLTIVWGAKESLYKIFGKKQLRFLENIYIEDFTFSDEKTTGRISFQGYSSIHQVHFIEFDGFTCVYAF